MVVGGLLAGSSGASSQAPASAGSGGELDWSLGAWSVVSVSSCNIMLSETLGAAVVFAEVVFPGVAFPEVVFPGVVFAEVVFPEVVFAEVVFPAFVGTLLGAVVPAFVGTLLGAAVGGRKRQRQWVSRSGLQVIVLQLSLVASAGCSSRPSHPVALSVGLPGKPAFPSL